MEQNKKEGITIDGKTTIPVEMGAAIAIFLCGLVLWAGRVEWVASNVAENTKALAKDLDTYKADVSAMRTDMLVIKCHIGVRDPACPRSNRPGQ